MDIDSASSAQALQNTWEHQLQISDLYFVNVQQTKTYVRSAEWYTVFCVIWVWTVVKFNLEQHCILWIYHALFYKISTPNPFEMYSLGNLWRKTNITNM